MPNPLPGLFDQTPRPFAEPQVIPDQERFTRLLGLLFKVAVAQGAAPISDFDDIWTFAISKDFWLWANGHAERRWNWLGAPIEPGGYIFEYRGYPCGSLWIDADGPHLILAEELYDRLVLALCGAL